jgi:hypothetical protein
VYLATSPRDFEIPQAGPALDRIRRDFVLAREAGLEAWELWRIEGPSLAAPPGADPPGTADDGAVSP